MNDFFWIGCCVGGGVFAALHWYLMWSYQDYLVNKSDPAYRTATKIGDGFFYIVPESEMVDLTYRAMTSTTKGRV